jgi:hypothetical protein
MITRWVVRNAHRLGDDARDGRAGRRAGLLGRHVSDISSTARRSRRPRLVGERLCCVDPVVAVVDDDVGGLGVPGRAHGRAFGFRLAVVLGQRLLGASRSTPSRRPGQGRTWSGGASGSFRVPWPVAGEWGSWFRFCGRCRLECSRGLRMVCGLDAGARVRGAERLQDSRDALRGGGAGGQGSAVMRCSSSKIEPSLRQ